MPAKPEKPDGLTEDVKGKFLRFLSSGLPMDTAARLVGVQDYTVRLWLTRARTWPRGVYKGFDRDVTRCLAEGEAILLARITEAGRSNWRADAWLLERMYPDRYGPPPSFDNIPNAPPYEAARSTDDQSGL
jgi:transposase